MAKSGYQSRVGRTMNFSGRDFQYGHVGMDMDSATFAGNFRRRLLRGLRYFLFFTVIGMTAVFYFTGTPETFSAVQQVSIPMLVVALMLMALDIALGSWRNLVLLKPFHPEVGFWLCLRAQLANEFAAAVTPGQSGGAIAWLYVLNRKGVKVARALAVSALIFLSTLLVFLLTTAGAVIILRNWFSTRAGLWHVFGAAIWICLALSIVVFLALWKPQPVGYLLMRSAQAIQRRWGFRLKKYSQGLVQAIHQYHDTSAKLVREHPVTVLLAYGITFMYYGVKLNMAYLLLVVLGGQIDYLSAIALLALVRFLLYFTPTPGGSGVGEVSIAALLSGVLPAHVLPLYTALYRSFYLFLPAGIGALVLLRELGTSFSIHPTSHPTPAEAGHPKGMEE
ncbi:MAG: UPF0104 family protein [Calditrichaeota bacterium]|nr:MAG: UPF0104 family protein [Calditrichota bacterium]